MTNGTNYFSPDYLFSDTTTTPSVYFGILTAAFAVIFVLSVLAYWRRAKLAPENPALRRFIRRLSKAGMWTTGIGLFLALMRYSQFPYLSKPILMDLLVLSMIVTVGYFVYDLSERYPVAVWQLEESRLERRYRPTARRRPEPQPVRPNRIRGKRRR